MLEGLGNYTNTDIGLPRLTSNELYNVNTKQRTNDEPDKPFGVATNN